MNTHIKTITALKDFAAFASQIVEHMQRQDWRASHAAQVSRHKEIDDCAIDLATEVGRVFNAFAEAGLDSEWGAENEITGVLLDQWSEVQREFANSAERHEEACSPMGRPEDAADDAYQMRMEAAE